MQNLPDKPGSIQTTRMTKKDMPTAPKSVEPAPPAPCVACGGPLGLFGRRGAYSYYRCRRCGSVQLSPLPDREELSRAYAEEYASSAHINPDPETCRRLSRPYYLAVLQALRAHGITGPVAEIGCGWGGLCDLLLESGFKMSGVEPSEGMAAHCLERGLPVRRGGLEALEGRHAALVMVSVFEHVVGHDAWLDLARERLEPGGYLVTSQPTARFAVVMAQIHRLGRRGGELPQLHQIFCPPWHTVLFSIDGMRLLMERHGFSLEEVRRTPQGREPGLTGALQRVLDLVNSAGWRLMRERWPLVTSHIFVFKKQDA